MTIERETPSLDEIVANITHPLPVAIANSTRPYTLLPSRRFEELLYAIYKSELENGNLDLPFNDISLMSGTREKGRDCGLYLNGLPIGLIQCKRYKEPIDTLTCIDEILKFVLNTLLTPELMQSEGTFFYYIVAASEFKNDTNDFIANFTNNIASYPYLIARCEKVQKEFALLRSINVSSELPRISKVLSRITIERLTNIDLDSRLNKAHNQFLLSSFFQVQTVLNEAGSQALVQIVAREKAGGLPEVPVILEKFKEVSSVLGSQIKYFGRSKKHIVRSVVKELRETINKAYEKDSGNVIFLPAKAGMGKSVAMADLLEVLERDGIPVLAIKSDKQYGSSLDEFEKKLSIPFSTIDALKKLAQNYDRVVLMIDQLDVLSQSFATNKEYLNTIIDLMARLSQNERIRIVISVRKFDLEHNHDLRFLNTTKRQIKCDLAELKPEEVKAVLTELGAEHLKLSVGLLKMLQTPKNLDVFCFIYHTGIDTGKLNTEYDLFGEFWKASIIKNEKLHRLSLSAFVYAFTNVIESRGELSLKRATFEEQYTQEIDFLLSQGVFIASKDELQLFHQTFFDYVVARQFHEQNRNLLQFIRLHENEINIRSTVRAVMYYSAQVAFPKVYWQSAQEILGSNHVTYNIKTIIIESIARDIPDSSVLHENIKRRFLFKNRFSQALFENLDNSALLIVALNDKWLDYFLSPESSQVKQKVINWAKKYDRIRIWLAKKGIEPVSYNVRLNIVYRLLYNKMNFFPEEILMWLKTTKHIEQNVIYRLLYALRRWEFPIAFELLNSVIHLLKPDSFEAYSILEHIADVQPQKAFEIYQQHIFEADSFKKSSFQYSRQGHNESKFLNQIVSKAPLTLLNHYLPLIEEISREISAKTGLEQAYFSELNLLSFTYTQSDHDDDELLTCLINASRKCASETPDFFIRLYEQQINTSSASVLIVLIFGLKENPEYFSEYSYRLIKMVYQKTLFDFDRTPGWYFRRLIEQSFLFFDDEKQKEILSWIIQIQPEDDNKVFEWGGKKRYPKWSGQTKLKFLQAIPANKLNLIPTAKKEFEELSRKFNAPVDEAPKGIRIYSTRPPLPKQAYEKMSLLNWKDSFQKYNSDPEREFRSDKGGLTEHARALTEQVAQRPEFFFEFLNSLIDQHEISFEYLIAGLDGLIKGKYVPEKVSSYYKRLIPLATDRYADMRLIWHSDYLIKSNIIDQIILDFIITQVKTHSDPVADESDLSPIQRGINSVRGAAADRLMSIIWDTQYYNQLIPVIDDIANDPSVAVKATLMSKLYFLLRSDRGKTYMLFERLLTDRPHPEFWKISVQTAQYLVRDHYEKMSWYFLGMLEEEDLAKNAVQILTKHHIWNTVNCRPVMHLFFEKYPSTIRDLIFYLDSGLVNDEGKNEKAIELYWSFLDSKDLRVADAYNSNMLHFKPEHFQYHKEYLAKFSTSFGGKRCFYYLWHYLLNCVSAHSFECLEIASNYTIADLDSLERDYIDDSLVRLIMAIYSHRSKIQNNKNITIKINTVLDRILLSEKYRRSISSTLLLSEE